MGKVNSFLKQHAFIIGLVFVVLFTYVLPVFNGLERPAMSAIGIFIFALFVWLYKPYAEASSSLLIIVFLIFFKVLPLKTAFGYLGSDTNFLVLSGIIMSIAMAKTGIARRIALSILYLTGKKASTVLAGLMIVNFIIAFMMPSGTARATLLLPITLAIITTLQVRNEKDSANVGKQFALTIPATDHLATSAILTATGSNIIALDLIKEATGQQLYYTDFLIHSLVPNIILAVIWWFMIRKLFPLQGEVSFDREEFKNDLLKMGKLSRVETKTFLVFVSMVVLWFAGKLTGLSPALVALAGAAVLFVPGMKILTWKEDTKGINWGLLIFNTAAIASGAALGKSGATEWMINSLFSGVDLASTNPYVVLFAVLVFGMLFIAFTSSKTGRITAMVPILIGLAIAADINVSFLVLPFVFLNAHHFIFPFNAKSNLIYYGTGHIESKDMIISGLIISVLSLVVFMIAAFTWWQITGLTP